MTRWERSTLGACNRLAEVLFRLPVIRSSVEVVDAEFDTADGNQRVLQPSCAQADVGYPKPGSAQFVVFLDSAGDGGRLIWCRLVRSVVLAGLSQCSINSKCSNGATGYCFGYEFTALHGALLGKSVTLCSCSIDRMYIGHGAWDLFRIRPSTEKLQYVIRRFKQRCSSSGHRR